MTNPSKTDELAQDQGMAKGVQDHIQNPIVVDGQSMTPAAIVQRLTDRITLLLAVVAARATLTAAVKAVRDDRPAFRRFFKRLRSVIVGMYGGDPKTLADFAITLHEPTPPTADVKAQAVKKREATREARHTMGKKQRAKIHGTTGEPTPAPQGGTSAPKA